MTYLVYIHTSPSGKSYVGRTKNYNRRCNDHKNGNKCYLLQNAIKEFGWDNFSHVILKDNLTLEEANFWEEFYIKHHNTFEPNGYNMQTGGIKYKRSKISIKRMSDSKKGKPSWNKGKKNSPEHVRKMALSKTGKKQSKEQVEKRTSHNTGLKRSPEFCQKMKELNIGRTFSPETLKRMSEGQKIRFAKTRGEIL